MGTDASKLVSMHQAIAEHVPSGSMVLMGAQLEQMIPFAAGHEIIRQGRLDLTLGYRPIGFEQSVLALG